MFTRPTDPEYVRIWKRVRPSEQNPLPPPDWSDFALERLACEERNLADYLRFGFPLPGARCRQKLRLLKTALYFLEVTAPCPIRPAPQTSASAEAFRRLYRSERGSEEDYAQAAQFCREVTLRRVFSQCADLSRQSGDLLWQNAARFS